MSYRQSMTLLFLACFTFFLSASPAFSQQFNISRFISPDDCGSCHTDIYDQWENSLHSLSHDDPVYLAVSAHMLKGLRDKGEIEEAESCVKCHTPVGYITGYPTKSSQDKSKTPEIATRGIQCDYCHSATHASRMYNNGLVLEPGYGDEDPGVKRGPFRDSESDFHDTAYSRFHTESGICGTCHNVKHVAFGTDLETTYQEWEKGPYNSADPAKRVTCQGCHMYQRPGIPATGSTSRPLNRGVAADDGPVRKHIFTHYFVGANGYVPGEAGDSLKRAMAEERLANAATLSIKRDSRDDKRIGVTITNSGAGHDLPTGLTDIRQMWLEISVTGPTGKPVFSSGTMDKDGYLGSDARIFNTVFGDGKGNPVINVARAREILKDKRIPPMESVTEWFDLPGKKIKGATVRVRLQYRSAPQKLMDQVSGKGSFVLPVVTMAEASLVL